MVINGGATAPKVGQNLGEHINGRKKCERMMQNRLSGIVGYPWGCLQLSPQTVPPTCPEKFLGGNNTSPCAPRGFSNYIRQIYAVLTFSNEDWLPRTKFGVCYHHRNKRGRYAPPPKVG